MAFRATADRSLAVTGEAVLLALVVLAPWAFGAVEPLFEFFLDAGLALLLLLWGGRMLLAGQVVWRKSGVALCLASLCLLAIVQLQPLPRPVLEALSPNTARLYSELLPAQPEVLSDGEVCTPPPLAAGSALSVCPGATRTELIRLLAVFWLFACVTNNVAPAGALRRLFVALVVNGSLMALFALVQSLTSPRSVVYWTFPTQGMGFGPFVNGSQYPFYMNVCIGAAVGLLLSLPRPDDGSTVGAAVADWRDAVRRLLGDSRHLWLGGALALMAGSVLLSLSRGGLLALLGATLVLGLPALRRGGGKSVWPVAGLLIGSAVLLLVVWLARDRVAARTRTLVEGSALGESRWPLWADAWPLVTEFPLLGTGLGTFPYVEPLHRTRLPYVYTIEHAHNEYLEALCVGGVAHLMIALAAIGLVLRAGYRAVRRHRTTPAGGLAVGALFGFWTFLLHSIGDFGVHLPAVALLITVLVAEMVSLAGAPVESAAVAAREDGAAVEDAYVLRLAGLAPLAGALVVLAMAGVLFSHGLRAQRAQAGRLLARGLQGNPEPAARAGQLALLEFATRTAPENASLQLELAQLQLRRCAEEEMRLKQGEPAALVAQLVLAGAGPGPWPLLVQTVNRAGLPLLPALMWDANLAPGRAQYRREHLAPALAACVRARNLNPFLPLPQLLLAGQSAQLRRADPPAAYLARARRTKGLDPEVWFFSGVQALADGEVHGAVESWRRCLELSDQRLPDILALGAARLGPATIAEQVLPDRPQVLARAAAALYGPRDTLARQRLLERALAALPADSASPSPEDLHLAGQLHAELGQRTEAVLAYRAALRHRPRRVEWRLELAEVLRASGQLAAARREVIAVLRQEPGEPRARQLLETLDRATP